MRNNNYQDRNHPDVTHYNTDVQVENVEFVGSKGDGGGVNNSPAPSAPAQQPVQQTAQADEYMNLSDFEEILSDGDVPF